MTREKRGGHKMRAVVMVGVLALTAGVVFLFLTKQNQPEARASRSFEESARPRLTPSKRVKPHPKSADSRAFVNGRATITKHSSVTEGTGGREAERADTAENDGIITVTKRHKALIEFEKRLSSERRKDVGVER